MSHQKSQAAQAPAGAECLSVSLHQGVPLAARSVVPTFTYTCTSSPVSRGDLRSAVQGVRVKDFAPGVQVYTPKPFVSEVRTKVTGGEKKNK